MDLSQGRGGGGDGDDDEGRYRLRYYILDGHEPKPARMLEWARWFEVFENRHVRRSRIRDVVVSTIFTGLDSNYGMRGPPILFETMTFGRPLHTRQWRCSTWDQALEQHAEAVALAHRYTRRPGGYRMRRIDALKRNQRQNNRSKVKWQPRKSR